MEPKWTRSIPSWAICDWFYLFFVINVVVFVTLMFSLAYIGFNTGIPKAIKPVSLFMAAAQIVVSGTSTLFFYLLCDRSLNPSGSY